MTARRRRRILVVEDDADIRDAVASLLEGEGFLVVQVGNGREALEYLRTHEAPALILLDLMMPVMDGWTFRAIQMADPKLARIPILVCSAGGHGPLPVERERFLRKPFELSRLLSAVRKAC